MSQEHAKTQGTLLRKIFFLSIPFIVLAVLTALCMTRAPMRFYDGEYPFYEQNRDTIYEKDGYSRVLILGDSVAKMAWRPSEISDDVYNCALGGVSPVEEYYFLKNYLQHNEAPAYLIYTQHITHFVGLDCFWTRGVYFHWLSASEVLDIFAAERSVGDNAVFADDGLLDIPLYYTYSPLYYSTAFFKGLLSSRQPYNEETYARVQNERGWSTLGNGNLEDLELNRIVNFSSFDYSKVIDLYLRKIIDLCGEHGIQFIYQSHPLSERTYDHVDPDMVSGYEAYMSDLQRDYPDAIIHGELFAYDDALYSDSVHLSVEGAALFSNAMKEKYSFVFET